MSEVKYTLHTTIREVFNTLMLAHGDDIGVFASYTASDDDSIQHPG